MLATITDAIQHLISSLYGTTGLLGIVLAMAIESCCLPLPSEIVMPLAGITISKMMADMLAHQPVASFPGLNAAWPFWVNLLLVALAGAIGCLLGSMAAYAIGYRGGRPLLLKYGKYVLISQHDTDMADRFFARWGNATAFFSRLLPIVRTYISLPAGIAKTQFPPFCLFTFLGSFPWCFLLAYVGYVLGNNLGGLTTALHGFDVVIAIAIVALLVLYIWRHVRNDRKARAEHAAKEAEAAPVDAAQTWNQPNPQQGWNQQNAQNQPNSQNQQFMHYRQDSPAQQNPQQGYPSSPQQQQWGQAAQPSQQQWNQPAPPQQQQDQSIQQPWGQPSQQQWGQQAFPQQNGHRWPPQPDDRSIRR